MEVSTGHVLAGTGRARDRAHGHAPEESLRLEVTAAIDHGTELIASLHRVADRFAVLVPALGDRTGTERWDEIAQLCRLDEAMPERLAALVESLADVLAGLTTTDGGEAWLHHRRATLDAGDDDDTAAA